LLGKVLQISTKYYLQNYQVLVNTHNKGFKKIIILIKTRANFLTSWLEFYHCHLRTQKRHKPMNIFSNTSLYVYYFRIYVSIFCQYLNKGGKQQFWFPIATSIFSTYTFQIFSLLQLTGIIKYCLLKRLS